MNQVLALLKEYYDVNVSKTTLRRTLKEMNFKWKRVKKTLKNKRDEEAFKKAKKDIKRIEKKHSKGDLKLYYFDQSGFSLDPSVPYAWQEKEKNIRVPSSKGGHLSVLGLLSPDNDIKSIIFESATDSRTVIYSFNQFFKYKRAAEKWVIVLSLIHI